MPTLPAACACPGPSALRCSHAAPELLSEGWLTKKADIYALALVMWACLTGAPAFEGIAALRVRRPAGQAGPGGSAGRALLCRIGHPRGTACLHAVGRLLAATAPPAHHVPASRQTYSLLQIVHLVSSQKYRLPIPPDVPEALAALIRSCWAEEASDRWAGGTASCCPACPAAVHILCCPVRLSAC